MLTVEQVAKIMQLNPATVRRQLAAGTLRGIKRGQWRIPESALTESTPPAREVDSQEASK
jgi:excisionase family DNA binding protein